MQHSRTASILWLLLLAASHPVVSGVRQCSVATGNFNIDQNGCASTQMHSKQTLLSRKKRYIFWSPGSAVLATFSFAKAIASQYPRGVNMVAEADLFYPLPTKITDWYPTTKKPPVAAVKSPKIDANIADTQYVPYVETGQQDELQQQYSMRPSDYWNRSPVYIPQPATSITRLRPATAYANRSSATASNVAGRRRYGQTATSWRQRPAATGATDRYYRTRTGAQQFSSYQDWRHHSGFRQRRDLYTQFEKMASDHGLSIRGCLLRMICEARHYLLPRGKSFFHDVLRIMFYVPIRRQSTTATSKEDEYAEAMRSSLADCTSAYRQQCHYSILGLLLSREQHTFA